MDMLFNSGNISQLINDIKYLKTARENNQKLLIQVQQVKLNFEEQKKLREQKYVKLIHKDSNIITYYLHVYLK